MDIHDLPEALNAPPNTTVELALSRILTASGLTPGELLPKLYDPANRAVLDLLRQGTNADTIADQWDRINPPVQTFTPAPVTPPVAPNAPEGPGPITWSVVTNNPVPVEAGGLTTVALAPGATGPTGPVTGGVSGPVPAVAHPDTALDEPEPPKVTAGPTTPSVPVTGAAPEATPPTSTPGTGSDEAPKEPSVSEQVLALLDQVQQLLKGGK